MLRMEIALFLVVTFVAYMYFTAEKEHTALHKTFSVLLVAVLVHLALDGCNVYTVNHLDTVPMLLNGALHRLFLGSMAAVIYISTSPFWCRRRRASPGSWTGRRRRFWCSRSWGISCCPFPTPSRRKATIPRGAYMLVPYAAVAFYLLLCAGLLVGNWKAIPGKKAFCHRRGAGH